MVDARRGRPAHNEWVSGWLRGNLGRLRPPWPDVALALAFTAAAVLAAWYRHRSGSDSGRLPLDLRYRAMPDAVRPLKPVEPSGPSGPDWGSTAALMLLTVPLAWRRRWPLAVLVAQFVGVFTVEDIGWPGFLAVLVGAYSLARHGRSPLLSLGTLLAAAGLVAASFPQSTPDLPGWLAPFVILVPIGLSGAAIRSARARADALAGRAALLEREQEAATRAAVVDERARIARELHDVVSHHVSVMTIQAGAAGRVLDDRPDLAREAIGAVETSGREAMGELRHLLGLLAAEPRTPGEAGGDAPPLRPQPGLDQLDALVAAVRAAGQPVTARTRELDLPGGVDLAAYRVVQEALTNALRYAPGARTEVVVDRDGDTLVIEVTDEGTGAAPAEGRVPGGGTGLLGLAERLGLYHGTLEASRRIGGGFRVRARIPLEPA
jgi:signal transduction histidine kinase